MKTTVDLPDELVQRIKMRAVMRHRKLKDTMAALLRLGLSADETDEACRTPRKGAIKLPLFECSDDAPARRMSAEELVALTHDVQTGEDIERLPL